MLKKEWTKQELNFLKENYTLLSNYDLAQKLDRTLDSVESKLKRFNLRKTEIAKKEIRKRLEGKFKHEEIVEEVKNYFTVVKEVFSRYDDLYKNIKLKTSFSSIKQVEDQVLLFSDMHTDMINKAPITGEVTYNPEIQKKELQILTEGLFRFYQLMKPSYNIETLYIFGLGDFITNDRIYEGQKMEIASGVGMQVQKTFYYISDMIKKLLEIYPRIVYINIVGNHGRTTAQPISEDATSNFEYLLGLLIKERFEGNKRVEIILSENYSYTYTIKGHKYLLAHGNTIRGTTLNSIERAAKDIANLVERDYYDVITIGHFHSCYEIPSISPSTTLLVNGCFIYKDDYAYTKLRKFSTAKQYLFQVSKKSSMHNLQKIDLRWK